MLDQQLNDDLHPQLPRLFNKGDDIVELAEAGIDLQMVAYVIPLVQKGRKVKRGDPDNRCPHPANVA